MAAIFDSHGRFGIVTNSVTKSDQLFIVSHIPIRTSHILKMGAGIRCTEIGSSEDGRKIGSTQIGTQMTFLETLTQIDTTVFAKKLKGIFTHERIVGSAMLDVAGL
jgi:hypothetical protein